MLVDHLQFALTHLLLDSGGYKNVKKGVKSSRGRLNCEATAGLVRRGLQEKKNIQRRAFFKVREHRGRNSTRREREGTLEWLQLNRDCCWKGDVYPRFLFSEDART